MANAAETMPQVMIEGVTGKLRAGAVEEAITAADRLIAGFGGQGGEVMKTFGSTLASLHVLRGTARRAKGVGDQDPATLAAAEEDLQRGLAFIQQHGSPSDAASLSRLVDGVRAASGGGAQVIAAFVDGARGLEAGSRNLARGPAQGRLLSVAVSTLLGGLLWSAAVLLFLWIMRSAGARSGWMLLGAVPLYLLVFAGLKGWRWYSQYAINTVGGMIKFFAFALLAISGVGTLPVLYWTGRGVRSAFGGQP